jgi:hypothetical protein
MIAWWPRAPGLALASGRQIGQAGCDIVYSSGNSRPQPSSKEATMFAKINHVAIVSEDYALLGQRRRR